MKKVLLASLGLVVMVALLAWAGGEQKPQMSMDMDAMKAEMSKCGFCKEMLPYMEQAWCMNMKHEVHNLKNGALFIHAYPTATEAELTEIHKMCNAMEKTSAGLEKMTAKQLEGKVCAHCQEWFSIMKDGATDEWVLTKTGSVGIVTSDNPKTVTKIHALAEKTRQMFAGTPEKM